jgi:hypothetical protein
VSETGPRKYGGEHQFWCVYALEVLNFSTRRSIVPEYTRGLKKYYNCSIFSGSKWPLIGVLLLTKFSKKLVLTTFLASARREQPRTVVNTKIGRDPQINNFLLHVLVLLLNLVSQPSSAGGLVSSTPDVRRVAAQPFMLSPPPSPTPTNCIVPY